MGQERPHPAGHARGRGHREPHGLPPHRGRQKKVEERNFEIRKNLLEYDEVMDEQRKRVYGYRQRILDGANCKQLDPRHDRQQVDAPPGPVPGPDYGTETFAKWAGKELGVEFDARDFRGMDFAAARDYACDQAERKAEGQVLDAIEENLPEDADPQEWNWEALAKSANTRWQLEPARPRPEAGRPRGRRRIAHREGPRGDRARST